MATVSVGLRPLAFVIYVTYEKDKLIIQLLCINDLSDILLFFIGSYQNQLQT